MISRLNAFLRNSDNRRQILTFALVGASGTIVHYLVLFLCVEIATLSPVLGTTLGAAAGAIVNYILNYYITFKSKGGHLQTAGKFFAIAAIGMLANALLIHLLVNLIGLHYIPGQLLTTGIVLILTYGGNRLWTFSK